MAIVEFKVDLVKQYFLVKIVTVPIPRLPDWTSKHKHVKTYAKQ
jgi:hypothetical protein